MGENLHPVDWTVDCGAVGDVLRVMNEQLRRRRRQRVRAMSAVALLGMGVAWFQSGRPSAGRPPIPAPSAVVSLPERQVLSDGSIVELRNGAQITVAFTDSVRRVVLVQGEVHFQVETRVQPFVVAVGGAEVRAVGTAFSVQLGEAEVVVMVTEGIVAVDRAPAESDAAAAPVSRVLDVPGTTLARVEAGNRVVFPATAGSAWAGRPTVVAMETAELAARLAWRVPRLEFSRTPLEQALAMMNQHAAAGRNLSVVLAHPSLADVRVSGVLRADNIKTLLHLLEEEHGIEVEYRSPQEIVLRQGR